MIARYMLVVSTAAVLLVMVATIERSALGQQKAVEGLAAVETCAGESIELNGAEKRMLDLHNQERAEQGLPALCVHPALTEAARFHSQEMLDKGYFSHDSFNGESVDARLKRLGYAFDGYSGWRYGENINWGSGHMSVPDYGFDEWMDSADHRANILDENFREIGIGARLGRYEGLDGAAMYTVDFGSRLR
jgi:uncharacterized protein YkwD